ncbi:hypothetical protein [Spirosoma jeollabukense]
MTVLSFRVNPGITKSKLASMDGKSFFKYAVSLGALNSAILKVKIGEVKISGDQAEGTIVMSDRSMPPNLYYRFVKEGGNWKFDFTSTLPILFGILSVAINQANKSEDDFVTEVTEKNLGAKLPQKVWEPL